MFYNLLNVKKCTRKNGLIYYYVILHKVIFFKSIWTGGCGDRAFLESVSFKYGKLLKSKAEIAATIIMILYEYKC